MATEVKVGLLVRLEAKPGKETEVAEFLKSALPIVQGEAGTVTWYAIRIGQSTFGIFDTFGADSGRDAHLAGQVAAALMAEAPELAGNWSYDRQGRDPCVQNPVRIRTNNIVERVLPLLAYQSEE